MTTYSATDNSREAQLARTNDPSFNSPTTITSEGLNSATPITVTSSTPSTGVTSATSAITSLTDANKAQSDADAQAKLAGLKSTSDSSLSDYLNNIIALGNEPAKESQMITDMGGDQAKIDADTYGSQIQAEQLATRHAVEDLRKNNPSGLFGGALEGKVNDIQNASLSKQADLAILQNTALKKYDVASDIATRKVQAETEGLKASLDARKLIYSNNKDSFDKEEQRQIDAKIKADDRAYQQTVADKTAIQNVLLEVAKTGNFTQSQFNAISNAKTPEQAIALAGKSLATPSTEITKLGDGSTVLIDKRNGNIIKTIDGNNTSTNQPATVVRTATVDGKAKPVDGYQLQSGDDPYVVAQNNGTDLATLQKLNPDVKDWHNLPVGTVLNIPSKDNTWLTDKSPDQINSYNALPEADKASVRDMINGTDLIDNIIKTRGISGIKARQNLINEAIKVDPNFSPNLNKQRYQYQTQFNDANGKEQAQINAINTGLGHLAEFSTTAQALGNTKFKDVNALDNYIKGHSGDTAVTNFKTVTTALAGELATIYKGGTAPSESEITNWENNLLASYSADQLQGVANTTSNLISNKMNTLGNSYKNVMGSYPTSPLINADVLTALANSGVDTSSITAKLKAQGYDTSVIEQDPNTTNINNFLSGKTTGTGNTLEDLWNK